MLRLFIVATFVVGCSTINDSATISSGKICIKRESSSLITVTYTPLYGYTNLDIAQSSGVIEVTTTRANRFKECKKSFRVYDTKDIKLSWNGHILGTIPKVNNIKCFNRL